MQGDQLFEEWRQAKEICNKIIDISIKANIYKQTQGKQNGQQFMKVYDVVYRLCSNRQMEETRVLMVYKDYKEMLKGALLIMAREFNKERDICKIKVLKMIWDAYEDILKRLKHMFAYLNRPFHLKQARIEDLDRTGMVLIVSTFFTQQLLLEYQLTYYRHIRRIRKTKDMSDSGILRDYVDILYRIHLRLLKNENKRVRTLYTDFHSKYLTEAKESYQFSFARLKQFSPSEYFFEVNQIYELEQKIAYQCFGINSDSLIRKVFSQEFLEGYRDILISKPEGLKSILHNRQVSTINIIIDLYKKLTNSIDGFKDPFQTFIYEEFSSLISQVGSELMLKKSQNIYLVFIQKLIKRSNQLAEILETSFMKYNQFSTYFKNGIQRAFSKNPLPVSVQQMLAIFVQSKLKLPFSSQDQLTDETRNMINIFACLENKDMFLLKYLQRLARRILGLTIQGLSNHQHFVYKLKMHSGYRFTERIQKIIDEYKSSMENDEEYRMVQGKVNLPYNMNLRIFSQGIWPYPENIQFNPDQLHNVLNLGVKCMNLYQEEMIKKKTLKISYMDSRFRWVYYFDEALQTKNSQCFFDTNGVQGVLLMHIYTHRPEKVNIKLLEQLYPQVKPNFMRKLLNQMSDTGDNVLTKITDEDEVYYSFNGLMKSNRRLIQYDSHADEAEQEQQLFRKKQIIKDREYVLDANIVKLMKSKKVLSFDKIVEEVLKMVKVFSPGSKDIKMSIDRLLVKELLSRDEKDKNILKYKD